MTPDDPPARLTVERRRAIFRSMVEAQDAGRTVDESRAEVGQRFGVTSAEVRAVEWEGVKLDWPPL